MTYVEIGNEDYVRQIRQLRGPVRSLFYDAIKAKYPRSASDCDDEGQELGVPDLVDEHFYRSPGAMEGDATHYDSYSRTGPKIFVGEWATRIGGPTPDMGAALSDAAWMTGLERNSDLVVMHCYAPLFVNVSPGAKQWAPDLIGYDALNAYGSPSYYAETMFSNFLGDKVLPITMINVPMRINPSAKDPALAKIPSLFSVATRESKTGVIYLKVVNTAGIPQPVKVDLKGDVKVVPEGESVVLAASKPEDTNTINKPLEVVPVTAKTSGFAQSFTRTFPPWSITVLKIQTHRKSDSE